MPVVAVKPKIFAEDLLVPIGALSADNDSTAVGRELESGEADGVEMVVECKRWFLSLGKKSTDDKT